MSTKREGCPAGDPEACPLNRRSDDPRWAEITGRLDEFEAALRANTDLTERVKKNTDDIITLFAYGKGFFRVMGMVGSVAKWVSKVAAALLLTWAVFRYGVVEIINSVKSAGKP